VCLIRVGVKLCREMASAFKEQDLASQAKTIAGSAVVYLKLLVKTILLTSMRYKPVGSKPA